MVEGEGIREIQLAPEVPHHSVRYKDFKGITPGVISSEGVIVTDLPPNKLWASQDWTDNSKIAGINNYNGDKKDKNPQIKGYYYDNQYTGQRAIIIGDGHHHA